MMKRLRLLMSLLALLVLLTGCTRAVGGRYEMSYGTADGLRFTPSSLGIRISLELNEDGLGTASYNGAVMDITWSEKGGTVLVESKHGTLEFQKSGDDLILHEKGVSLYLNPVEEEEN